MLLQIPVRNIIYTHTPTPTDTHRQSGKIELKVKLVVYMLWVIVLKSEPSPLSDAMYML